MTDNALDNTSVNTEDVTEMVRSSEYKKQRLAELKQRLRKKVKELAGTSAVERVDRQLQVMSKSSFYCCFCTVSTEITKLENSTSSVCCSICF